MFLLIQYEIKSKAAKEEKKKQFALLWPYDFIQLFVKNMWYYWI